MFLSKTDRLSAKAIETFNFVETWRSSVSIELEVSITLVLTENRRRTDRRTDRRTGATLNATPYGWPHNDYYIFKF